MNIFITGATGYIGEHLAIKLKSQNHEVFALVRSINKAAGLATAGINLIGGDLSDKTAIEKGMKNCDVVFHLAAYASVWPEDKEIFNSINVEGTRNILDLAKKNNIKKVVITSTAGVYGPSPSGSIPVNEETIRTIPYFSHYESTKAEAENLAKAYAKEGLHVVIVNPARVYGPGRRSESNAISKLIELYLENKWHYIPGSGEEIGSYSYIDDIVDGHIQAMESGRSGENYLLGGENASYEKFFEVLKKYADKDYRLFKIPSPLLFFASHLMVVWARIFKSKPLITPKWVEKYMHDWSISSQKAMDELGYKITPLEEGLKRTINWLKDVDKGQPYTLVTGSSTGIGKAMAEECAKRKHNLVLVALPGTELEKVGKYFRDTYHVDIKFLEINLTLPNALQELHDWCDAQQIKINVLINNAGIGNYSSFEKTDLEKYLKIIHLNTEVVVSLTSLFIPKLREHRQSYILNVGSIASLMPVPYKSVYSASKSFVLSFSRALQIELKQYGIHVSCLCPGPTSTETVLKLNAQLSSKRSKKLWLTPEKVAQIAINGLFERKGLIIPGWKNRLILSLNSLLPFSLRSYLLLSAFKNGVEKKVEPDIKSMLPS